MSRKIYRICPACKGLLYAPRGQSNHIKQNHVLLQGKYYHITCGARVQAKAQQLLKLPLIITDESAAN